MIIATTDWKTHLEMLEKVLIRLRENGLKFKPSKCSIGQEEVHYLGHVIGKDGLKADPDKVAKMKNAHDLQVSQSYARS